MLVDSGPQEECGQSQNLVMVGKAKIKWSGVKWVSNHHVRKKDKVVCLSDTECSYPHKEGPSPPVEGWHHTLKRTKPELTAKAQ